MNPLRPIPLRKPRVPRKRKPPKAHKNRRRFVGNWLLAVGCWLLNTADRRFLLAAPLAIIAGCSLFNLSCISNRLPAPPGDPVVRTLEVTGYCNCGKCCSWERSWWGFGPPVYTAGKMKGKRKEIGVTASGSKATRGTIAADVTRYPMGTVMFVPGYGWGRVEDRGGAIVGEKIDLWFPTHQEAKNWGRQKIPTKIWLPPKKSKTSLIENPQKKFRVVP